MLYDQIIMFRITSYLYVIELQQIIVKVTFYSTYECILSLNHLFAL